MSLVGRRSLVAAVYDRLLDAIKNGGDTPPLQSAALSPAQPRDLKFFPHVVIRQRLFVNVAAGCVLH